MPISFVTFFFADNVDVVQLKMFTQKVQIGIGNKENIRKNYGKKGKRDEKNGSLTIDNYRFFSPACSFQPVVNCPRAFFPFNKHHINDEARAKRTKNKLYRYFLVAAFVMFVESAA